MFYLTVIICGIITIAAINARFTSLPTLYCILTPIILTVIVVLIDGVFAFLIRRLPQRYFDEKHSIFDASIKERKLYELLGIKFWKDYVLELGGFTDFHKNKIINPNCPLYLKRFILECNYGSLIHLVTALTGFLLIFITPINLCFNFALPVSIFNCILNLLPLFILRYNTPRLKKVLKINLRKEKNN